MRSYISKKNLVKSALKASADAVEKTIESGGVLTYQSGKNIFKEYPDGAVARLVQLDRAYVIPRRKLYKIA